MISKILVPLDGSSLAERALPLATEIAKGSYGCLVLLRAVAYFTVLAADPLLYEEMNRLGEDEALAYLRQVRNNLSDSVPTDVLCEVGSAADAILRQAQEDEIDLIVMSSHGRSGFNRWVYGSVAERVMGQAPCPTLIINGRQPPARSIPRRILVPLDGSELAERALTPALELVEALGSDLHLLRVATSERALLQTESMAGVFADMESKEIGEAQDYLQEQVESVNLDAVQVSVESSKDSVAGAIIDYAARQEIDLIVMSSHGRTGLQRWVYGSVAEKVLRSACCATMIVRSR